MSKSMSQSFPTAKDTDQPRARSSQPEASAAYGSFELDDDRFLSAMETGSYPPEKFRHADHIRLAWIYIRTYAPQMVAPRISYTIRHFAARIGKEQKYHETITTAWLRLVEVAHRATPEVTAFDDFLLKHAWLLDRDRLSVFYSSKCLSSEQARTHMVPPDRYPLP
jgi:hypothetical protein